jgi:ribosomal protein S6E (S10)
MLLNGIFTFYVMNSKLIAILLAGIIASGMIYTHPAFAHNFGGDESATWLAKVAEIKTEVSIVAKHVGDKAAIGYYSDALGEYWNVNDTREMGERNTLLQKEIPGTINATLDDANKAGNENMVNNDIAKLNGYLDESVTARVDKDKLSNSTIQALAVTFVLKESLEKYGDAVNSTVDLNDMSQMNMSGGSMSSGMPMASTVVDQNKYENSIGLATTAQNMFNDLAAKNTDKSDANSKISAAFTKLLQDLNAKADVNTIMMDVHTNIHPPLIDAYKISLTEKAGINNPGSAVPEFPIPAFLAIVSIAGVVAATRFKSRLGF